MRQPAGTDRVELLYVCVSNVCRSVLAEHLTRQQLPSTAGVRVGSAGTDAVPGRLMHPLVRDILRERGAGTDAFASRRVGEGGLAAATLVLAATTAVRDSVIAMLPAVLPRAFTVREFARLAAVGSPGQPLTGVVAAAHQLRGRVPYVAPAADDIPDPRPTCDAFRVCADTVAAALVPVVSVIAATRTPESVT